MDSQAQTRRPALRSQQKEMIPAVLLRAMFGIALASLVMVSYAVYTGREKVGQPEASAVVREKWIVLEGKDAKHVVVRDTNGNVLVDLPEGGFITVIQSGVHTERRKKGADQTKPVRIVEYANGRLAAEDPETGWSVELYAFGADNKAAFQKLLDM
ncbi:photosynthetic complex assembly protein PuhC [Pseudogemmobacter blasticus]|uniref:Photosynthetic complex assembly protein n=1 Tax=Fuscovulum blasticum DSM 2131 TaxID=1188250 RepID=A0A2T4J4Z8_FUSBL|nr:photosynthetic complex assembly protein PuhC [Fuscovulum blasticum]PTE12976.1 photosynthetic complex assembly protein [Fuscovulum blasticum DSM 2131]